MSNHSITSTPSCEYCGCKVHGGSSEVYSRPDWDVLCGECYQVHLADNEDAGELDFAS